MSLSVVAPVCTSRGDLINEFDRYVQDFGDARVQEYSPAIEGTKELPGRPTTHALFYVKVGNCEDLQIDRDTGFIGTRVVLKYCNLLCEDDIKAVKKESKTWLSSPASKVITDLLLRRDRGTSSFTREDVYFNPLQLLGKLEVGISTRTWLLSTSAYALSLHQFHRAYKQCPSDFKNIRTIIQSLKRRVKFFESPDNILAMKHSLEVHIPRPYEKFEFESVIQNAVQKISLLTRVDLCVLTFLMKEWRSYPDASSKQVKPSMSHLKYLSTIVEKNGDLWIERSSHIYKSGSNTGAIFLYPSGYIHPVEIDSETEPADFFKDRTYFSKMESIIPYIPFELSGYEGNLAMHAITEASERKGKKGTTYSKADVDEVKQKISAYANRVSSAIILYPPLVIEGPEEPVEEVKAKRKPIRVPPPSDSESGSDTEKMIQSDDDS